MIDQVWFASLELNFKNSENSSHNLADQAIKIAMDTQESLRFQRSLYKGINKRFLELGQKFPMLNSLIGRIQIRKRRDSLIMGVVIGFCIILILFYSGWIWIRFVLFWQFSFYRAILLYTHEYIQHFHPRLFKPFSFSKSRKNEL